MTTAGGGHIRPAVSESVQPVPAAPTAGRTATASAVLLAWAVALALVAAAWIGSVALDRPVTTFTREPQSVAGAPWYAGALSIAALLGWWTIAVTCAGAGLLAGALRAPLPAIAVVAAYLGLDDAFQLHELVLPDIVGIPQTVVLAAYAGVFGWLLYAGRRWIRAHGWRLFALGAALLVASAVLDLIGDHGGAKLPLAEDGAKLLGIATWIVYFGRGAAAALGDGRAGRLAAER